MTTLSSMNTSGLDISKLSGKTLVQYAGSLTGCDFHAIIQAAPFVLYDLIPDECYKSWLALSSVVPLIWQPVIHNLKDHVVSAYFLANG